MTKEPSHILIALLTLLLMTGCGSLSGRDQHYSLPSPLHMPKNLSGLIVYQQVDIVSQGLAERFTASIKFSDDQMDILFFTGIGQRFASFKLTNGHAIISTAIPYQSPPRAEHIVQVLKAVYWPIELTSDTEDIQFSQTPDGKYRRDYVVRGNRISHVVNDSACPWQGNSKYVNTLLGVNITIQSTILKQPNAGPLPHDTECTH